MFIHKNLFQLFPPNIFIFPVEKSRKSWWRKTWGVKCQLRFSRFLFCLFKNIIQDTWDLNNEFSPKLRLILRPTRCRWQAGRTWTSLRPSSTTWSSRQGETRISKRCSGTRLTTSTNSKCSTGTRWLIWRPSSSPTSCARPCSRGTWRSSSTALTR